MAVNTFTFDGAVLTNAAAKYGGDVPSLTKRVITAATITNGTGGPIAATVYLANAGGAGAANMMISARPISPGESYVCPELLNQGIDAGGAVWALGNVAGLTFKFTAKDVVAG